MTCRWDKAPIAHGEVCTLPAEPNRLDRCTWAQLVELLRQRGLTRSKHDNKRTMIARLASHALGSRDRMADTPKDGLVTDGLAIDESVIRELAFAAAAPEERCGRFGRANLASLAATLFLRQLAEALGWPDGALPADLARSEMPQSAPQRNYVRRLLGLWISLFDSSVDAGADSEDADEDDGEHAGQATFPARLMATLSRAIVARRCVRIVYRASYRAVRTDRVVEPLALRRRYGRVYLYAFCRWRQDHRRFRLDRITRCAPLDERFGCRE